MNATAPVEFYFDFISPFGCFASLRMEELAARHSRGKLKETLRSEETRCILVPTDRATISCI